MEHRTALALAGAVVMVAGSGAFTVGALTGAVGPDADDLPDVSPTTVGAADDRQRVARDERPTVERVTRYVDVPVPAPGPAAVGQRPVAAAAQPASTGVVAADPESAEDASEAAEEQAERAEERFEERHELLEERRDRLKDLREDLREEAPDGDRDGDGDGGGHGHG